MKNLERELRLKVRIAFEQSSSEATPMILELLKTKEGYRKAEEMVISYALKNRLSISASIAQIEAEL